MGKVVAVSSAKGGVGKSTVACSSPSSFLLSSIQPTFPPLSDREPWLLDVPGLLLTMADSGLAGAMLIETSKEAR